MSLFQYKCKRVGFNTWLSLPEWHSNLTHDRIPAGEFKGQIQQIEKMPPSYQLWGDIFFVRNRSPFKASGNYDHFRISQSSDFDPNGVIFTQNDTQRYFLSIPLQKIFFAHFFVFIKNSSFLDSYWYWVLLIIFDLHIQHENHICQLPLFSKNALHIQINVNFTKAYLR